MRWLFVSLLLGLFGPLAGQYHLSEFGLRVGVGPHVPIPSQGAVSPDAQLDTITDAQLLPHAGFNLDLYWSHWICGKRFGYYLEAGWRQAYTAGRFASDSTGEVTGRYSLGYGEIGAYFKFRKNDYHLDREWAVLVGPKLNVRATRRAQLAGDFPAAGENRSFPDEAVDPDEQATLFLPGVYLGMWFRFPMGKKSRRHWFIAPGLDYYFLPNATTAVQQRWTGLYPHVSAAMTFWNNR